MVFHSSFVLHTYPWRDSSLLVELFTENEGRISAIAKGVRRRTSTMRGILMPFTKLSIRYSKKGELRSLMSAEWDATEKEIISGKQLFAGFYINELILKFVQKSDSCNALFSNYELTLKNLALFPELEEVHLRKFEFFLLKEVGVLPDFSGFIYKEKGHLYLTPEHGFLSETDYHDQDLNHIHNFFLIESDLLKILQKLDLKSNVWTNVFQNKIYWSKVKSLLRFLLNGQLNSVELKSRRIMREIKDFSRGFEKKKC